tara:strand:+ start:575 stop:772 length:198 start_codon:yes stop_codon:yes gene_type:complete
MCRRGRRQGKYINNSLKKPKTKLDCQGGKCTLPIQQSTHFSSTLCRLKALFQGKTNILFSNLTDI